MKEEWNAGYEKGYEDAIEAMKSEIKALLEQIKHLETQLYMGITK